ncbi:MAG: HD domain-containing protein [Planctomycetes bacterium]|nr:HD domain-containing protein [Planctomycetota bacterium]
MKRLASLLALGQLDKLPRTGWIQAGVADPESVAGHVLGVCHLALATCEWVEPRLDFGRVMSLILVHDAPEALSGDLPRAASAALPGGAKASMEQTLAERLLASFPPGAGGAWTEWCAQTTREARFAKLCDRVQLGVRCLQLHNSGQLGLADFWQGLSQLDASEFPPLANLLEEILQEFLERGAEKRSTV